MKKILVLLSAALLAFSCKTEYEVILYGNDIDEKMNMAFEMFEAGRYQKAASLFESLSPITHATSQDDTVRYYLGLSNYYYKDYFAAETNFKTFLEYFPLSGFSENASFLRLDCLYRNTYRYELDQIPTNLCMTAIREYQKDYPDNTHNDVCEKMLEDLQQRLDTKAYEAARLYFHMEDYIAATTAFRNVLKGNSENIYREDILYYIAKSSFRYADNSVEQKKKERFLSFIDDYYNFVGEYTTSSYRRELDVLYKRAQRYLGKYNDVTEELLAKETAEIEKASKRQLNSEELKVKNFGKAGMSKEEIEASKAQAKEKAEQSKARKEEQKAIGKHYDKLHSIERHKRQSDNRADNLVQNAEDKSAARVTKLENKCEDAEEKAQKKGKEFDKAPFDAKIKAAKKKGEAEVKAAKAKRDTKKEAAEKKYHEDLAAETKNFETLGIDPSIYR